MAIALYRQLYSWLLDLLPCFNANQIIGRAYILIRRCIFKILSVGPLPTHVAFIMDGNRRYARKHNLKEGDGHRVGFLALMSLLKYCYELKISYITVYAFSIDNFKRGPKEVKHLMELMQEKVEGLLKEESIVNEYGVKVLFVGNLNMFSENVHLAMQRVMKETERNAKAVLVVCVAYTSSDEIVNAVTRSIKEKISESNGLDTGRVELRDIERHLFMSVAADPDILIRSSGETRLSNFLLWQTTGCLLYCPKALWPELGLRHMVWSILNFQRHHGYLEKKKKKQV